MLSKVIVNSCYSVELMKSNVSFNLTIRQRASFVIYKNSIKNGDSNGNSNGGSDGSSDGNNISDRNNDSKGNSNGHSDADNEGDGVKKTHT